MLDRGRYDMILDSFRDNYKNFYDRTIDWYSSGRWEITVILDDDMRIIYNMLTNSLMAAYRERDDYITEDEMKVEFSKKIRTRMRDTGYTQKTLSEVTGITQANISKYISGKSLPGYYNATKICQALGCTMSELTYF